MQGKRTRRAKRQGIWSALLLLLLMAVLTTVVFARAISTQGDTETTAYIEPTPAETATPAPLAALTPSPALVTESPTETQEPVTEAETEPVMNDRYASLSLTQGDIDMLAAITFLEAGNQSAEGQQAVVEVVLNRVLADNFPDTVQDVLFQTGQFTPAAMIPYTEANPEQYDAVNAALTGENILPEDVVYFSTTGENNRVWGTIGAHVFCLQYVWG